MSTMRVLPMRDRAQAEALSSDLRRRYHPADLALLVGLPIPEDRPDRRGVADRDVTDVHTEPASLVLAGEAVLVDEAARTAVSILAQVAAEGDEPWHQTAGGS